MLGLAYTSEVTIVIEPDFTKRVDETIAELTVIIQKTDLFTPAMCKSLLVVLSCVRTSCHLHKVIHVGLVMYRRQGVLRVVLAASVAILGFGPRFELLSEGFLE